MFVIAITRIETGEKGYLKRNPHKRLDYSMCKETFLTSPILHSRNEAALWSGIEAIEILELIDQRFPHRTKETIGGNAWFTNPCIELAEWK